LTTILEKVVTESTSSLQILVNPKLSDIFYWHFHPEFELVYIEGANGIRHVGNHYSKYKHSDLVLIGSNIPHLNFDYGVKTEYEKIVVHSDPDFLKEALYTTPELSQIHLLLERSKFGIAFGQETKDHLAGKLKGLNELNSFDQFIGYLSILQFLATAEDVELLHSTPVKPQNSKKDGARLQQVYLFIESNYQNKINLMDVADRANLTKEAFCRYFKKMTKLTFTEFVNQYRIDKAKKLLLQDYNVTEAGYSCGFETVSYFNRTFKRLTKENPLAFKNRQSIMFLSAL